MIITVKLLWNIDDNTNKGDSKRPWGFCITKMFKLKRTNKKASVSLEHLFKYFDASLSFFYTAIYTINKAQPTKKEGSRSSYDFNRHTCCEFHRHVRAEQTVKGENFRVLSRESWAKAQVFIMDTGHPARWGDASSHWVFPGLRAASSLFHRAEYLSSDHRTSLASFAIGESARCSRMAKLTDRTHGGPLQAVSSGLPSVLLSGCFQTLMSWDSDILASVFLMRSAVSREAGLWAQHSVMSFPICLRHWTNTMTSV